MATNAIHTELEAALWARVYAATVAGYAVASATLRVAQEGLDARDASYISWPADEADAAVVAFRKRWVGNAAPVVNDGQSTGGASNV